MVINDRSQGSEQGRINHCASYSIAWGLHRWVGGELTGFFSHK